MAFIFWQFFWCVCWRSFWHLFGISIWNLFFFFNLGSFQAFILAFCAASILTFFLHSILTFFLTFWHSIWHMICHHSIWEYVCICSDIPCFGPQPQQSVRRRGGGHPLLKSRGTHRAPDPSKCRPSTLLLVLPLQNEQTERWPACSCRVHEKHLEEGCLNLANKHDLYFFGMFAFNALNIPEFIMYIPTIWTVFDSNCWHPCPPQAPPPSHAVKSSEV